MADLASTRMSEQEPGQQATNDPELIRAQLKRVLGSSAFRNSKRYPRFLKLIVEQTLLGRSDSLKERLLGIEVFDRKPDYDLATDPIVRVAAGEIRKRLAQYYIEYGHETEIRIQLQAGSYVPEFLWPRASIGHEIAGSSAPEDTVPAHPRSIEKVAGFSWKVLVIAGVPVVLLTAVLSVYFASRPTQIDRFWNPFVRSANSPMICLGDAGQFIQEGHTPSQESLRTGANSKNFLSLGDVESMNRVSRILVLRGKSFTTSNSATTTFADLRRQPTVLIGGRSNQWTMRSMQFLRYQLVPDISPGVNCIRDREDTTHIRWSVDFNTPFNALQKTYAIVARFNDPTTGQPTVIIDGLGAAGTIAAADFVTTPAYFREFADRAPRGWEDRNVEIVLEAQMVNGDYGPPHVVATYLW